MTGGERWQCTKNACSSFSKGRILNLIAFHPRHPTAALCRFTVLDCSRLFFEERKRLWEMGATLFDYVLLSLFVFSISRAVKYTLRAAETQQGVSSRLE